MTTPDSGLLRLGRAAGFGLAAFALSVAAHVAGGGQLPSGVASLVLVGSCVWVSVFLTWRPLGVATSVLSLAALQALLHGALMLASSLRGSCTGMIPGHTHALAGATSAPSCAAAVHQQGYAVGTAGVGMTLAHAAAAVLLGVLLSRADRAVWFLCTLRLCALPAPVRNDPPVATTPVVPEVPSLSRGDVSVLGMRWRGPPTRVAPALG